MTIVYISINLLGIYILFYSVYWLITIVIGSQYEFEEKQGDAGVKGLMVVIPAYNPQNRLINALEALSKMDTSFPFMSYTLLQEANEDIAKQAEDYGDIVERKNFRNVIGNPYHHVLRYISKRIDDIAASTGNEISHIILLDKDNIVSPDFLNQVLRAANKYDIVQGRRKAYNSANVSEKYDSISESLNDIMFRASKTKIGLPAEISGSGILFKYEMFKHAVNNLDSRAPGMDKNLMIQIITSFKDVKIGYQPSAIIFDEKTDDLTNLQNQRMRWFGNQYFNAYYYTIRLIKFGIANKKMGAIDYAISLWRPPRSIHLVLLPVMTFVEVFIYLFFGTIALWFPYFTISLFIIALATAIFLHITNNWRNAFDIAFTLPKLAINNLKSAINGTRKKNQGKFINTKHS